MEQWHTALGHLITTRAKHATPPRVNCAALAALRTVGCSNGKKTEKEVALAQRRPCSRRKRVRSTSVSARLPAEQR